MHPDAQIVLAGFKAFAEGDMATMRGLFHDDAVWHAAGQNRWSGDHEGADAILQLFAGLASAAQITNNPHGVLADDDHVVVLTKTTFKRDGKSLESDGFFIFHVTDGKVKEAWAGSYDPYATDAFWA